MKYPLIILITTFLIVGCEKRSHTYSPLSTIDVAFDVQIVDRQGTDLLDPKNQSNPNFIENNKMKVQDISVTDDAKTLGLPPDLNHPAPEHFMLIPPDKVNDKYRMRFYFNPLSDTSTLLITFKEGLKPDTLIGKIIKPSVGEFVCTSIRLNSKLIWSRSLSDDKERKIVKVIN